MDQEYNTAARRAAHIPSCVPVATSTDQQLGYFWSRVGGRCSRTAGVATVHIVPAGPARAKRHPCSPGRGGVVTVPCAHGTCTTVLQRRIAIACVACHVVLRAYRFHGLDSLLHVGDSV